MGMKKTGRRKGETRKACTGRKGKQRRSGDRARVSSLVISTGREYLKLPSLCIKKVEK